MNWFQNSLARFRRRINPEKPLKDQEGGTNVSEQYEHYITQSIRIFYSHRLLSPVIYLAILLVLFIVYPLRSMLLPISVSADASLEQLYRSRDRYIAVQLDNLRYTGYRRQWLSGTNGYYYYTVIHNEGVIVLLSPDTCDNGVPEIASVQISARIMSASKSQELLIVRLSDRLNWADKEDTLIDAFSSYMLSEPDCTGIMTVILRIVIWFSGLFSVASIAAYLIFMKWPRLSPPVMRLASFGNPRRLLDQAEQELADVPQLATEDMFITQHFFIETSSYGVAIVPIQEILWVYKYSSMHRFFWHNFSITYTLYIVSSHRQTIHCPRNTKSDIDGIIDYLSEANPDILVGFTEENRLKVAEKQGEPAVSAFFGELFHHRS